MTPSKLIQMIYLSTSYHGHFWTQSSLPESSDFHIFGSTASVSTKDDALEKSIEISKMPDIYAGAYVTLSATRSATANEGFLHDLHHPELGQESFRLPYACPNGLLGFIILYERSHCDPHRIDSRAWTLQEYVLSRRVIKFSVCQLHWTCRKVDLFQPDGRATAPSPWSSALSEMVSIHRFVSKVPKDEGDWMEVVYAYYRAPSWSWASTDNVVEVIHERTPAEEELLILGHQVQTAHQQAPFGAVTSGEIIVHGQLRAMLFIQSSDTEQLWSRDIIPVKQKFVTAWPETGSIDRDPRTLPAYCLQVCKYNAETGNGPSGLTVF